MSGYGQRNSLKNNLLSIFRKKHLYSSYFILGIRIFWSSILFIIGCFKYTCWLGVHFSQLLVIPWKISIWDFSIFSFTFRINAFRFAGYLDKSLDSLKQWFIAETRNYTSLCCSSSAWPKLILVCAFLDFPLLWASFDGWICARGICIYYYSMLGWLVAMTSRSFRRRRRKNRSNSVLPVKHTRRYRGIFAFRL